MQEPQQIWVGIKRQRPGYAFETADYDHLQIIAVTSGQLSCDCGAGPRRLGPSSLLVLPPGSTFALWCDQGGYRGVGVNVLEGDCPEGTATSLPADAAIRQLVGLVERELTLAPAGSAPVLRQLGLALSGMALRAVREQRQPESLEDEAYWSERVRQAIDNYIGSDMPLRGVLDGLGLGYRQLTRHFVAAMGMAPKQYQLLRRIEEAQRLLQQTRLSITSIAVELGFPSSQHFATQFKRITGYRPSQFRTAIDASDPGETRSAS